MIAVCFNACDLEQESVGFCEWVLPNGDITRENPAHLIDDEANCIIEAYMHYKNGFLPIGNGLLEQSNLYLECMSCVQQWINKNAEEARRKS